jgi:hypothetical protein
LMTTSAWRTIGLDSATTTPTRATRSADIRAAGSNPS